MKHSENREWLPHYCLSLTHTNPSGTSLPVLAIPSQLVLSPIHVIIWKLSTHHTHHAAHHHGRIRRPGLLRFHLSLLGGPFTYLSQAFPRVGWRSPANYPPRPPRRRLTSTSPTNLTANWTHRSIVSSSQLLWDLRCMGPSSEITGSPCINCQLGCRVDGHVPRSD